MFRNLAILHAQVTWRGRRDPIQGRQRPVTTQSEREVSIRRLSDVFHLTNTRSMVLLRPGGAECNTDLHTEEATK